MLYKDCQADYDENLRTYLATGSKASWDNIFIDFKTYCFNKIRKMRPFLPVRTIDDWATTVACNALDSIIRNGADREDSWPINMGAYLGLCCLDINNIKKYNREKIEIPTEDVIQDKISGVKGETLMTIGDNLLDDKTGVWIVKEAVKMTVFNDGYSMLDVDRTIRLINKYNGKIGRFSKKNLAIKSALERNIEFILNMNREEI